MKFRLIAPVLAVALLAMVSNRADAGLFAFRSHGGCGCEPACGAPAAGCCDVGPSCCDSGCGHHRGLLSSLFHKHHGFGGCGGCCDSGPACGCAPEPTCGVPVAHGCGVAEPVCGYAQPACGCAPTGGCCGQRRCGLLHRLFAHKLHHFGGGGCGCAAEPACGCEPTCGCH